ncbi:hypothetical protein PHLCEN_2v6070 [Hermanssonia centrifuga]|uniref:Kinetochore protein SPC25 n=1 Tax=Hermanssonia centrifuga TaxID=98765 RepID=A0A2R6P134_9APHY|nr:hypothetical protein PHLCEN_2v6070 [Hermanssonia centrifuga]
MAQTHVLRVPKLDLPSILAQQNPHIDLKLEAYEISTRNFLTAVSGYTQRALAEITHRKNAHVTEKNKIAERTQQVENETNACKVKELELIASTSAKPRIYRTTNTGVSIALEREREERKEAELSVAAFERQLASIKEQCALLDMEIEQRRVVVLNLQRERNRERSILNSYASKTSPELLECERRLHSAIEGIGKDKILVRFTHLDPAEPGREFSFVIDLSSKIYKGIVLCFSECLPVALIGLFTVPTTSPFLPTLPILVDELNQTRDVYTFIKQVRQAFVDLVTEDR